MMMSLPPYTSIVVNVLKRAQTQQCLNSSISGSVQCRKLTCLKLHVDHTFQMCLNALVAGWAGGNWTAMALNPQTEYGKQ